MITSSQVLGNKVATAATVRLDRDIAGWNWNRCLRKFTGKIRLDIVWRIPVGFEDGTGFHLGVQPARKDAYMEWERTAF